MPAPVYRRYSRTQRRPQIRQRLPFGATSLNIYEVDGSGGISFGGSATVTRSWAISGSGGIVFGGSATLARTITYTGSGGIIFAGSATVSRTYVPPTPTGGIIFGGSATIARTYTISGSGGIIFGGSATVNRTLGYTGSGGISLGGEATVALILTTPTLAQVEGSTRNDIFKRFLRETGLGVYGTVTGIAGGATTSFDDTTKLKSAQFPTDQWKGAWARVSKNYDSVGTAPENETKAITAYDPATNGRITAGTFSAAIAAGDEYEIWRFPNPAEVIDDLNVVMKEDIFLPCWTILSEAPDFDMEQNNTTDWTAGANTTLSKSTGEPVIQGARWLALSSAAGNSGSAYNTNPFNVEPNRKYAVSVVCYNTVGVTLTLEAYNQSVGATIKTATWDRRYPGRIHFEFTTPSNCYNLRIFLRHGDNGIETNLSYWDELCLYQADAADIALPWWVKNKNQIRGVFSLKPIDIGSTDGAAWDALLTGSFIQNYEIRDNAFGRGQLRLVFQNGNLPGPLFIFGLRNETAFTNDNTDTKRVDQNLIIAALAYRVFKRLKTFPNSNAMQTKWIETQFVEWEKEFKKRNRSQSERIEEVIRGYMQPGQFIDTRFALNRA